jgi:hypothetical protein
MKKFIFITGFCFSFLVQKESYSYKGQLTCQNLSDNLNQLLTDFPDGRVRGFCNAAELSCERLKHLKSLEEAIQKATPKNKEALSALYQALSPNITSQVALDLDACELALFNLFPAQYRQKFLVD